MTTTLNTSAIVSSLRKMNQHGIANVINSTINDKTFPSSVLVSYAGRLIAKRAIEMSKSYKTTVLTTIAY